MVETPRRAFALAVVLALVISFSGVFSHSLWTPDEPTGAVVGLNMVRTGDWVVPRLGGEPFLEKPPLYWWVQAFAYETFGVSDAVARFPSALFMALTLLLTYAVARRLENERAGLVALVVLGSTLQFNEDMGRVVVDSALTFFVFACWAAFIVWDRAPAGSKQARGSAVIVAIANGLAFLSKGWVGCGLAVAAPSLFLLLRDRRRALGPLLRLAPVVVLGLVALGLPWALALGQRGGIDAVRECLLGNLLGRFVGTAKLASYGHRQPPWYYITDGLVAAVPWIVAVPAAWLAARREGAQRFLLGAGAVGVVLLSLAASKRTLYLVPLFPGMAIAVASWLTQQREGGWQAGGRFDRLAARALMVFAGIAPFLLAVTALGLAWLPGDAVPGVKWSPLLLTVRRAPVPGVLGLLALLALAWCVVLLPRLGRAWKLSAITLPVAIIAGPPLALLLAGQLVLKWSIDPLKNLHDTTEALAAASPDGAVALYRPGTREEKIAAIVDFDLDRLLSVARNEQEAASFFARHPHGAMLAGAEELGRLPESLRESTRVAYDERGRKASPYVVLVPRGLSRAD
ncbi:MAG: glycosyltransferase family 39 protein [Acidobacteriota bacterium]